MEKKKILKKREEEEQKKKAALETKIRKRVAAEEKAYRIVERFVDETVSEDFLKDAGQFITPSHYSDIVVERAIAKLCGYPICNNILTNVSKQKYHISTKTNKVFDITERKNFCSNQCFKSSKYFEKQISDIPVWGRDNEPRVQFDLLPQDSKSGSSGQEVIGGKTEVMAEIIHLAKLDRYESKQKHKVNKEDKNKPQSERQPSNMEDVERGETPDRSSFSCPQVIDEKTSSRNMETESKGNSEAEVTNSASKRENILSDNSMAEVTKSASQHENSIQMEGIKSASNHENSVGAGDTKSTRLLQSEQNDSFPHPNENKLDCENLNDLKLGDTKNESKPFNVEQADNQAKVDYLMKLLDKRKHLLNKVAQIENVDVVRKDAESPSEGSQMVMTPQNVSGISEKLGDQFSHSCKISDTESVELSASVPIFLGKTESAENDEGMKTEHSEGTILKSNSDVKIPDNEFSGVPPDLKHAKKCKQKSNSDDKTSGNTLGHSRSSKQVKSKQPKQNLNTVEMICRSMKSWITPNSLKLLKISTEEESIDEENSAEIEARYEELEKRLGIDTLVGESAATGPGDHPQNPVPDYAALEKDTDNFSVKVNEFYKGSFTYKATNTEKQVNEDIPVYLPSIDSHNQMLIRRKIVMERFDKSMPDLLPPMKLSIQDVFTELRQLVATFSLDNKNILFKPAEWIIVSLVILKLLSRRNQKVAAAFDKPSCKSYLSVLLRGINETLESFDTRVSCLM